MPSIKRNIYKVFFAPRKAERTIFTLLTSMENINIGSLDLSHLKTELHNNTGEQSDAHISKSRVGEKNHRGAFPRGEKRTYTDIYKVHVFGTKVQTN